MPLADLTAIGAGSIASPAVGPAAVVLTMKTQFLFLAPNGLVTVLIVDVDEVVPAAMAKVAVDFPLTCTSRARDVAMPLAALTFFAYRNRGKGGDVTGGGSPGQRTCGSVANTIKKILPESLVCGRLYIKLAERLLESVLVVAVMSAIGLPGAFKPFVLDDAAETPAHQTCNRCRCNGAGSCQHLITLDIVAVNLVPDPLKKLLCQQGCIVSQV